MTTRVILFHGNRAHRDLHSFPTRRSSDLRPGCRRRRRHEKEEEVADWISSARSRCLARSEEHTSELQSHSDLVCRLLLEKKKDECRSVEATRFHSGGRLRGYLDLMWRRIH